GGSFAETYCTIVSIAESKRAAGLLWVGTDDGKVWVSRDAGAHWTDLTGNLRGVPPGLYVGCVEPSNHDSGTAYVAIAAHRSDVFSPLLMMTKDYGKTWTSIVGDLPKDEPVKVVREDLENPDLLFAGTEFGFYTTLDRGVHWIKLKEGLPTVAVDDIVIHPRARDLVIATHGRSVYVLDDVAPLERWSPKALSDSVTC